MILTQPPIVIKEIVVKEESQDIILSSKIQNVIPIYDVEVYKSFYNTIHPDYYETYIKSLLTETETDRLIRRAYGKIPST